MVTIQTFIVYSAQRSTHALAGTGSGSSLDDHACYWLVSCMPVAVCNLVAWLQSVFVDAH